MALLRDDSPLNRAWWWTEVALLVASPILAINYLFPRVSMRLVASAYALAVLLILAIPFRKWRHQRRVQRWLENGRCCRCGCSLQGLSEQQCPECGASTEAPDRREVSSVSNRKTGQTR